MKNPKLRTANKVVPPYPINQFPKSFVNTFGEEIVYMLATKSPMSIEGEEWEQVFAKCVGATWKPSNVGLDDVVLGNCCWSANAGMRAACSKRGERPTPTASISSTLSV